MSDEAEPCSVALQQLLLEVFDGQPQDLLRFCRNRPSFQPAVNLFGLKSNLLDMIDDLVGYCRRAVLLDELEAEVRAYTPPPQQPAPQSLPAAPAYVPPPPPDPDQLPEPGRLPPGSRLPFGRNALFTGREAHLRALARDLLLPDANAAPAPQILQGMGGIGKTQLAVEFACRYGRFFHGVHWLACAKPESISDEVALCGQTLKIEPWPDSLDERVDATLKAWTRSNHRHLVILDNLEDPKAAREWLRRLSPTGAALLLTARRRRWPRDLPLEPLRLPSFTLEESLGFLRQYLPEDRASDAELRRLSTRLGRLPLALELAGRYLAELETLPVGTYLEKMSEALTHPSMLSWEESLGSPTGHDLNLVQTFALSWNQVQEPAARRLFRVAAHCAPGQPIPCGLLAAALALDEEACALALGRLASLGLLDLADPVSGPTLHPLLAEFARTLPADDGDPFDALASLAPALSAQAEQANDSGLPATFAPLRPHLEAIAPAAEQAGLPHAGRLWNLLGIHRRTVADYPGARVALERSLQLMREQHGQDPPHTPVLLHNLGVVLHHLGDLDGARTRLEQALETDEAALGPDDPSVARDLNSLGMVLLDLEDRKGAREHFERALRIDEAAFGPDHPSVANRLNSLGGVLHDLGDLPAARTHYQRAIDIFVAAGEVHRSNVAIGHNNLGRLAQDQGDLEGARSRLEQALAIDSDIYGPDHPNVAMRIFNLGAVLKDLGDLDGARDHFERALAIWETVLGPEHFQVAIALSNLSMLLQETGDLQGALEAGQRAFAIFQKRLPAGHSRLEAEGSRLAQLNILMVVAEMLKAQS